MVGSNDRRPGPTGSSVIVISSRMIARFTSRSAACHAATGSVFVANAAAAEVRVAAASSCSTRSIRSTTRRRAAVYSARVMSPSPNIAAMSSSRARARSRSVRSAGTSTLSAALAA